MNEFKELMDQLGLEADVLINGGSMGGYFGRP